MLSNTLTHLRSECRHDIIAGVLFAALIVLSTALLH